MTKNYKMIIGSMVVALIVIFSPIQVMAAGIDVYIVYDGSDKAVNKALKKSLSGDLKVKTYNTKLLAMADYSGKQKAVSKISKARLVVFVKDVAYKALGSPDVGASITVTGSTADDLGKINAALN